MENRTLCRARALSKREAFVASGRGRRQPTEAGADSRSERADSPRKAATQNGCDVYRISACRAPHQRIPPPAPRRIELCAGRGRKENAAATQSGTRFPNDWPDGKRIPESAFRLGRSFLMTPQAETATRNRAVEWDMLSPWQPRRKAHPRIAPHNGTRFPPTVPPNSKTQALSIPKLGRRRPKRNSRRPT